MPTAHLVRALGLAALAAGAHGCAAAVDGADPPAPDAEPSPPARAAGPGAPPARADAGAGAAPAALATAPPDGGPAGAPGAAGGEATGPSLDRATLRVTPGRGFYGSPLAVSVSTTVAGAQIRYTLDGRPPTATTGQPYAGPIAVKGTTVLRAAAFKDGAQVSYLDTHTYLYVDDVIRQSPQREVPPGWPATWGSNVVDYGMDPRVVDDPRYSGQIRDALRSIPTFSLVMKLEDLFDAAKGIYANARMDGPQWERPGSLELIVPDGKPGFQINAGFRIRGGFSRDKNNPKHAFRVFFRREHGDPRLRFPLFKGPGAATELDKLDLRCAQNYSWSFQGDQFTTGIFIRDQFSRDTQLAMGQQGERGDFYHLYINGQYWGLYNSAERPSADYAAAYWGGRPDDWDTVKVDAGRGYVVYATDGTLGAWNGLYEVVKAGPFDDALFFRIQGKTAAGVRDDKLLNLVDVENLIDYMLLVLYTGNFDAPLSRFLGDANPNNYYALRNRLAAEGFRFVAHDSEHTLFSVNENRLGPYPAGDQGVTKSNPQWLFQKLLGSAQFRARFAERAVKHLTGGGALTPAESIKRFLARKAEIDKAVIAESARWGDAKRKTGPLTRDDHWLPEINRIVNQYLPMRTAVVIAQLRARGLFPN